MASATFDKDAFIGAYTDAAAAQAGVIAGAFEAMERRMDARFDSVDARLDRIEGLLEKVLANGR